MATESQHWAQVPLGFEIPIGVKQPQGQCRNIGNHRVKRKARYQVQALGLVVLVCFRDLSLIMLKFLEGKQESSHFYLSKIREFQKKKKSGNFYDQMAF